MAKYATLKAAVEAAIKTNGQQQITGQVLQTQLVNMITSLGKYFQSFGGLATPAGSFSAGDESVTFLAVEAGTYTNFGGAVLDGKTLHILYYDGSWHDADTSIPSGAAFSAALALAIKGSQSGIAEGIADTISAGTAQEFLQRQSGGDGVNCIKRIKGKTIAWNNVAGAVTFTNTTTDTDEVFNLRVMGSEAATSQSDIATYDSTAISTKGRYAIIITASKPWLLIKHSGSQADIFVLTNTPTIAGHKYILSLDIQGYNPSTVGGLNIPGIIVTDLTLLGLGDLTVDQFRALYPALYYAPASVLKSNDAAALLTDGRNQWDEEYERGKLDFTTGEPVYDAASSRSKNFCTCLENKTYYFKGTASYVFFYDSEKNYISSTSALANTTFTSPSGACYFKVLFYGQTSVSGVCVNLSDPSFNGTYQPYWQRVLVLRLSELTSIPEGGTEADRVTMFPHGAGGAGSAFDSIFVENGVTKARKTKTNHINLGGLDWAQSSEEGVFYSDSKAGTILAPSTWGSVVDNAMLSAYTLASATSVTSKEADKTLGVSPAGRIFVYDSRFSSPAAFAAAIDGVYAEFQLATPIVYTDLQYADGTPFTMPATILVDNYGTERIQAPEGATTPSAPFCCDSNYSIGVANLVKRLAALENAE